MEWKWKQNLTKFMGHNEGGSKFPALSDYIKQTNNRPCISNLRAHLKDPEQKNQNKQQNPHTGTHSRSGWQKIIKLRAEINNIETTQHNTTQHNKNLNKYLLLISYLDPGILLQQHKLYEPCTHFSFESSLSMLAMRHTYQLWHSMYQHYIASVTVSTDILPWSYELMAAWERFVKIKFLISRF